MAGSREGDDQTPLGDRAGTERGPSGDRAGTALAGILAFFTLFATQTLAVRGVSAPTPAQWLAPPLLFFLVHPVVIAIHEAGHSLVGSAVGFRSFRVVVGKGHTWARFDVGRTRVELQGLLVGGGATEFATTQPRSLLPRHALAVAAGPLAPALLAVALLQWHPLGTHLDMVRTSLIAVAVLTGVCSLIPIRHDGMWTDGLQLLKSARRDAQLVAGLLEAHDVLAYRDAIERRDVAGLDALGRSTNPIVASASSINSGALDEGIDVVRAALGDAAPEQAEILRNNLACGLAKRCGPGDIAEAVQIIDALRRSEPAFAHTIGLVLLRADRPDEAVDHLRSAAAAELPMHQRAEVCAHLAEATYASGDVHTGRQALAAAVRSDATSPDLLAALHRVAAEEATVVLGFWNDLNGDDLARGRELAAALGNNVVATLAVLEHRAPSQPELAPVIAGIRAGRVGRAQPRRRGGATTGGAAEPSR